MSLLKRVQRAMQTPIEDKVKTFGEGEEAISFRIPGRFETSPSLEVLTAFKKLDTRLAKLDEQDVLDVFIVSRCYQSDGEKAPEVVAGFLDIMQNDPVGYQEISAWLGEIAREAFLTPVALEKDSDALKN